jgi:hypothetical protein
VPATSSYDYAIIRVVPHVERGECLNVGVILFCRTKRFLGAEIQMNPQKLLALAPTADLELLQRELKHFVSVCNGHGSPEEKGPIGQLSQSERFHWLVSPRSTSIQTSPVHSGLCVDPSETLQLLVRKLVL